MRSPPSIERQPSKSPPRPSYTPRNIDVTASSLGALLIRSPATARGRIWSNAEMVVWQTSRRILLALIIAGMALMLRAFGFVEGVMWPITVAVPIYLTLVVGISAYVRRRARAPTPLLVLLALADLTVIFATIVLLTEPNYYSRALFLSFLALQFTQLFFGVTPALAIVVGSMVGYLGLLWFASAHGTNVAWLEELSVLAIYLVVALNAIALYRSANRRLSKLVELFAGAQRGDFSRMFTEEHGREPDGITLLGRSYNHLRSELATMVMTDTLTGCLNRRGFDQVLTRAVESAVRHGGELALLAVDIDHFKQINDTVGHLAGDAVLRELAGILSRSSRGGDIVARVGGEEFVVLLPGADSEMAGVAAERVMTTIRAHDFRTVRGAQPVTVSIGIAAEQIVDRGIAGALRARADEALYVAKRLGRDRVVLWAPGIRSNATPPMSQQAVD